MVKDNKSVTIILVVLLGLFLQVVLISADSQDKPYRAAVAFTKAYFWLDQPAMADRMINEGVNRDEIDVVDAYVQYRREAAQARGFGLSRFKSMVSHIETQTVYTDETTATVHLTAETHTSINPVFGFVAKLFGMTEAQPVTETFTVIRDGHRWRVSGMPFEMADAI